LYTIPSSLVHWETLLRDSPCWLTNRRLSFFVLM
jgi:hypothetical protein